MSVLARPCLTWAEITRAPHRSKKKLDEVLDEASDGKLLLLFPTVDTMNSVRIPIICVLQRFRLDLFDHHSVDHGDNRGSSSVTASIIKSAVFASLGK